MDEMNRDLNNEFSENEGPEKADAQVSEENNPEEMAGVYNSEKNRATVPRRVQAGHKTVTVRRLLTGTARIIQAIWDNTARIIHAI